MGCAPRAQRRLRIRITVGIVGRNPALVLIGAIAGCGNGGANQPSMGTTHAGVSRGIRAYVFASNDGGATWAPTG